MPFTIAHAVVAPALTKLSRGNLAASALAVGAMSPDFQYVLFLESRRTIGHTPLGLLEFCLPASLAVLLVWHGIVKRPLAGLLPERWAHLGAALSRSAPMRQWRVALTTVVAIVVGAWTHIVWDSFTHVDGTAVEAFAVLRRPIALGRPLYEWLQYGCGLVGLVVLGAAVISWSQRQPLVAVVQPPARRRMAGAASIAMFTLAMGLLNVARMVAGGGTPSARSVVVAGVIGLMSGAAAAVTAYGVAETARRTVATS